MIVKITQEHKPHLIKLLESSGHFDSDALEHVIQTLDHHLESESQSIWLTAIEDEPIGFAYCAPEPLTEGTWNLLMLWLKPGCEGKGVGSQLVENVEKQLEGLNARLLIVETSHLPDFEGARKFYTKTNFIKVAEIPNYFSQGDHKVIFSKPIGQI